MFFHLLYFIAVFNFVFKHEPEQKVSETVSYDTKREVLDRKESLYEKVLDWFDTAYEVTSRPVRELEDIQSTIDKGFEVVEKAKKIANILPYIKECLYSNLNAI